jgi:hypothetical protein
VLERWGKLLFLEENAVGSDGRGGGIDMKLQKSEKCWNITCFAGRVSSGSVLEGCILYMAVKKML